MRGKENKQLDAFSYVSMEDRIPVNHPSLPFRKMVNEFLEEMDESFKRMRNLSKLPIPGLRCESKTGPGCCRKSRKSIRLCAQNARATCQLLR